MLIARLIAETDDCETRLDALAAQLAGAGMPLAAAALPTDGDDVLELRFSGDDAAAVLDALDRVFSPADMLVSRGAITIPQLFVSDMDSTMIGQECIDELADLAGVHDRVAAITARSPKPSSDRSSRPAKRR